MVFLAVLCTFLSCFIGAIMEPVCFSVAFPIATMGGFIIYTIQHIDELKIEPKNETTIDPKDETTIEPKGETMIEPKDEE